jgi:hypothetical protein
VQFRRAIERGNVVIAEATAHEIALSLEEALQLVLLYAAHEPAKLERAALRWFRRYLDESRDVSLLQTQIALAALGRIGRSDHDQAAATLAAMAREATRNTSARRVAS